jgi:hypothetical protein
VDHAAPHTFEELAQVELSDTEDGQMGEEHLHDGTLCTCWQRYHAQHARLRIVSRPANLSTIKWKPMPAVAALAIEDASKKSRKPFEQLTLFEHNK